MTTIFSRRCFFTRLINDLRLLAGWSEHGFAIDRAQLKPFSKKYHLYPKEISLFLVRNFLQELAARNIYPRVFNYGIIIPNIPTLFTFSDGSEEPLLTFLALVLPFLTGHSPSNLIIEKLFLSLVPFNIMMSYLIDMISTPECKVA